jgi:hypothetical protein
MKTATHPLAATVDKLGTIRAAIDKLQREADALRLELEMAGLKHIPGELYDATISQCTSAARIDWPKIAARLNASPQLIRAHTTPGTEYARLTMTAK